MSTERDAAGNRLDDLTARYCNCTATQEQIDQWTNEVSKLISARLKMLRDRKLYRDAFQAAWVMVLQGMRTRTASMSTFVYSCASVQIKQAGSDYKDGKALADAIAGDQPNYGAQAKRLRSTDGMQDDEQQAEAANSARMRPITWRAAVGND